MTLNFISSGGEMKQMGDVSIAGEHSYIRRRTKKTTQKMAKSFLSPISSHCTYRRRLTGIFRPFVPILMWHGDMRDVIKYMWKIKKKFSTLPH